MKFLYWFSLFLIPGMLQAQALTVSGIQVSATADSSAAARDKALDKAHDLAFERLVDQNFPEVSAPLPPHDKIVDMVSNFSIDREKATAKSYTASLTFQFDGTQVQDWVLQRNRSPEHTSNIGITNLGRGMDFKIKVSYDSLEEWQQIKKEVEGAFGVQKVATLSLSPQSAMLEVKYAEDIQKLQKYFNDKGWILTSQEEGWSLSRDKGRRS
ncbi:MAG: hypothetical protein K2X28_01770 [Alphaproteobacteria bacterium]|nr:hypothetical protein [Alphaproteobacteria bacterium]